MPGPDFPDWSQQTVAGIRYAGPTPVSSGGSVATLDIPVTTFERAVLIHTPDDPSGDWTIQVVGLTTGRVSTIVNGIGGDQWIVAYVNPAFDPTWRVEADNAGAFNLYCDVFVDTTLPLVRVANVAGQEIPVTISGTPSVATFAAAVATVLVAAPSSSEAIRVWGWSARNATLTATWSISLVDGGGRLLGDLGGSSVEVWKAGAIPAMGVRCAAGTSLTTTNMVPGQTLRVIAYYTIEPA